MLSHGARTACWLLLAVLAPLSLANPTSSEAFEATVAYGAANSSSEAGAGLPGNDSRSSTDAAIEDSDFDVKISCRLSPLDESMPNQIHQKVKVEKEALIEYVLTFPNYTRNPLLTNMTRFYHSDKWSRVTTVHGQTLLALAFNYGILSINTLKFGTTKLHVELVDSPPGCMGEASEDEKIASVRYLLTRDFRDRGAMTLVDDERVCHEVVIGVEGYAYFKDRCYFKDPVSLQPHSEDDADSNFWLNLLHALLVIIKFGLLLFGPSLFIEAVESMSQEHIPYVVTLSPKDSFTRTVVIAQKSTQLAPSLRFKNVVDLRARKGFPKLKDATADMLPGKPTKVKFSQYDIMVNYKRMLTENIVEVGLMSSLFRAIFKCKIRNVGPFEHCCKTNMLMGCPGAKKPLPWIRFFRKFANGLLVVLIPVPYYVRLLVFYLCEWEEVMARKAIIERNHLKERYENSIIHYFTPTHWLFIVIYVIYATTAVLLAFMSRKHSEGRIMQIIVGAFRDLRTLSWTETLSMLVSNLLWPLKHYGLLGFLVGIVYWPIAIPITTVIALVYFLPTAYLSVRMIFYSKSAIFERARRRKKNKPYQVSEKTDTDMHNFEADKILQKSPVRGQSSTENVDDLGLDDIDNSAPKEHFKKNLKDNISLASSILKYQALNWRRFVIYVLSAILCIATLYAVVIILAEVLGCLVEVIVFTIMGIIVNASAMLKYVMLILMIFIYGCDCFNCMEKKYLKLNKALFGEIKSRIKNLSEVTSRPADLQENTGFKSQELGEQAEYESPDMIVTKPLNHWMINDLALFIDSQDMPRIPRQLFDEVCEIRVAGVPGPVFRGLLDAFEQFFKAIMFVLFVFIIVLTFGAVYKVSSANQTLATIVGGFVPMMLKSFLSPPNPDVELGTVSFKSKLDEVIKNFSQYWPMYDLPFQVVPPEEAKDAPADGTEDAEKKDDTESKDAHDEKGPSPTQLEKVDKVNSIPPPVYVAPPRSQLHASNLASSMQPHEDKDGNGRPGFNEASSMLHNNNTEDNEEHEETPTTPTVGEKCVRIAEDLQEVCEVDVLIYMPDKYDDVWLDEWSDIASRTSKTHVNAV